MDYIAANGKRLTDEDFDRMAEEYEKGAWKGKTGKVTLGRPRLSDEDAQVVSFKLPVSMVSAIDKRAKQQGKSRSDFLRDAVGRALVARAD